MKTAWIALALLAAPLLAQNTLEEHGSKAVLGDQQARPVPDWVHDTIIYQMWLPAYGPKDCLKNAETHLPHVRDLGATMIQLSPVHPTPPGAGPYSISNYDVVDAAMGGEEQLHHFVARAHELGLKVIMDVVFFHAADNNPLLREHPEMFLHDKDGKLVLGQWKLPRWNPDSEAARKYLYANLVHWVKDFGVDGFRADVAGGLDQAFWDGARAELDRTRPGVFLLAEATAPELMLHAFDATYGVLHMFSIQRAFRDGSPASLVRRVWEINQRKFPKGTVMIRCSDNHDQRRAVMEFGNNGALAASAMNLTMDGIPFLYNGQEIGDPAPLSIYGMTFPIHWETGRAKTMTVDGVTFWRGSFGAQDLPIYKKLIQIRKSDPAFTRGDLEWVSNTDEDRIVSYLRKKDGHVFLIVVNTTNRPWKGTVGFPVEQYRLTNLMTGATVSDVSLGTYGYLIAKCEHK